MAKGRPRFKALKGRISMVGALIIGLSKKESWFRRKSSEWLILYGQLTGLGRKLFVFGVPPILEEKVLLLRNPKQI